MRQFASVSALALATTALAQDPTVIHVGNNGNGTKGLLFTPNSVSASNGTVITFVFDTPTSNHTVAQSSFASPCEPLAGGFDSGYTPGPANAGDPPATWNLTITNDAKPIWFYCAQEAAEPFHCTAGMVGAINAPASPAPNDFDAFRSAATGASTIVQPTAALTGVGAFASAAPTVSVSSATDSSSPSDSASPTDSASPSDGGASPTDSAAAPAPTTQAGTPSPTQAPPAPSTNGALTTMTVSSTMSGAPGATSNAAAPARGAGAVGGTNGLVWAVAAAFGVALL